MKFLSILLFTVPVFLISASVFHAVDTGPENYSVEFFLKEYQKDFHPNQSFDEIIFVSIKNQKLYHLREGEVYRKYNVSTSKYGVGTTEGSQKTPIGLHKIQNKIGVGCPINSILKMGYCSGEIAKIITGPYPSAKDVITTRILWLNGLETGVNKGRGIDTYGRNIYIHGTDEEGMIGTPASHGCVRMTNADVLQLFNSVQLGYYVLILDH